MDTYEFTPENIDDPIWQMTESKGRTLFRVRAENEQRAGRIISTVDGLAVTRDQLQGLSPWLDDAHRIIKRIHDADFDEDREEILVPADREVHRQQIFGSGE